MSKGESKNARIEKTEKKVSPNGQSFDIKTLIVEGDNIDKVKEVFDERWR